MINFDIKENKVIEIDQGDDYHINIYDQEVKLFLYFNIKEIANLNIYFNLNNANADITLIDVNQNAYFSNIVFNLSNHSNIKINNITLACACKKIKFEMVNQTSETACSISNNVVSIDDSDFEMKVIGRINKGSKNSKSFQKNRCLTLSNAKKLKIEPILIIDENDVEASHSLAFGTIDEEVMFYMTSRGLTKKECLYLTIASYLLPSEEFYNDFNDVEKVQEEINERVKQACLM